MEKNNFYNLPPVSCNLLSWLFEQQHSGISLGLERMQALLEVLGNPQDRVPCFHIAGTNGKGSVAAVSNSILKAAGLRVGLYTSPHLVDFRERIQINGEMISSEALEEGVKRLQVATRKWKSLPTFFELTTALAFDEFARQECDVMVLETGLGGRLDATNLARHKIACAITPISLDHQALLGSTLKHIAREKAGIMRSGVPVIVSPQAEEVMEVLKNEAKKIKAPLIIIDEPIASEIPLGLAGSYQRWNAAVALKLVQQSRWKISHEVQSAGLKNVSWPGRFQCLRLQTGAVLEPSSRESKDLDDQNELSFSKTSTTYNRQPIACDYSAFSLEKAKQLLILDGAHNPGAAEQLVTTWKEVFGDQKCCLVFGSLVDKEGEKMLRILEPIAASIILVPVHSPRTALPVDLQKEVPFATIFSSLNDVLEKNNIFIDASSDFSAVSKPPILLTGSLFLVGEALAILQKKHHSSFSQ